MINWDEIDEVINNEIKEVNHENGGTQIDFTSEPHLACCLLVDTSGSMGGAKIQELNEALHHFKETVCADPLSAMRVDICVIEFNTNVNVVTPFCPIKQFVPPTLSAYGGTSMGKGIRYALEAVHEQVHKYHSMGIDCFKPFVLMITDGCPTDDVDDIPALIQDREERGRFGKLRFHAFGVKGADMDLLSTLCKRYLAIDNNAFDQIFNWASESMQIISNSQTADPVVSPNLKADMHVYDPITKKVPWND